MCFINTFINPHLQLLNQGQETTKSFEPVNIQVEINRQIRENDYVYIFYYETLCHACI